MIPSYKEALISFTEFLKEHKCPESIAWVTYDDIIYLGKKCYIIENDFSAERYGLEDKYNLSGEKPFGIKLSVCAVSKEKTFCYSYLPEDQEDADRRY
ncbi:MAG: hypothetical protein HRT89_13250 [Lentisphaeria bacterium]|nr:hypothetical protein [Lentisphaeria bacterium]NQZ69024.1 hypothetical protein [Lentisphaeria bacterium]